MTTTTTHSIINSTNPNPARNYSNTQHNTTPTHTPITTKTKKLPPHTSSKHCDTNLPLPHYPPPQHHHYAHPLIHLLYQSTQTNTTSKSKNAPSNRQSKHMQFTFPFITNCSNYISKLNLTMNLAKLCTGI